MVISKNLDEFLPSKLLFIIACIQIRFVAQSNFIRKIRGKILIYNIKHNYLIKS